MKYTLFCIMGLSICGFLLAVVPAVWRGLRMRDTQNEESKFLSATQIDDALKEAMVQKDATEVLTHMHHVLSGILSRRFPEITANNSTYQQWKAVLRDEKYHAISGRLVSLDTEVVEELFEELEKRNDQVYAEQDALVLKEHQEYVAGLIRDLAEKLREKSEQKEENNGNPPPNFSWS